MSGESKWTDDDWRDMRAVTELLLARMADLNDRLTRIEDRLKWRRKVQPRQRKHAG